MENNTEHMKDILIGTGKKKGLSTKEHIEKDYFQDLFLYHLFRKSNKVVFKGGTALYKIYELPRFSEDLDFNLIGGFDIERLIREVAGFIGNVKSVRKTGNSLLIKIAFKGILTKYNTLRIDVSIKNKNLRGFDVKNYVPEYVNINPFSLKILKLEEMIAEKTHSILAREKARDLYDLFFLLRMSKFDKELVDEKLAIFDMHFNLSDFKKKVNGLERVWKRELGPFIMTEPLDFKVVKNFVIGRIKC